MKRALALLLLAGCAAPAGPAPSAAPSAAPPKPGLRDAGLVPGHVWTYDVTREGDGPAATGTYTIEVLGAGSDVATVRLTYAVGPEPNVTRLSLPTKAYVPFAGAAPTLAFAALGRDAFDAGPEAVPTAETVTVPAGTYAATRFAFEEGNLRSCCVDRSLVTTWFVAGVGMVKQVATFEPQSPPGAPLTTTLVLRGQVGVNPSLK